MVSALHGFSLFGAMKEARAAGFQLWLQNLLAVPLDSHWSLFCLNFLIHKMGRAAPTSKAVAKFKWINKMLREPGTW